MIHILPQSFRHGPVDLIGVHDGREDILFAPHNLHGGLIGFGVKLLGKLIAAVIVEIGGVHIENQFSIVNGIRLQPTGGDCAGGFHLGKQFRMAGGWLFEVDVIAETFRDNIRVAVAVFFPFIVLLGVADVLVRDIHISGACTVDSIVSGHKNQLLSAWWQTAGDGDALPAGSVITHYNTFSPEVCKVPWALPRGSPRGNCGHCDDRC